MLISTFECLQGGGGDHKNVLTLIHKMNAVKEIFLVLRV